MKILLIGPAYPLRGGNALFVAHLYEALSTKHSVDVVSFSRLYPKLLFPGVRQNDISGRPLKQHPATPILDSINPRTWYAAVRHAAERKPDAVVFTWWNPFFGPLVGIVASQIKKKLHIPIIIVAENVISHEGRWIDLLLTKFALNKADKFLVLSKVVEETVRRLYPSAPLFRSSLPVYDCYQADAMVSRDEAQRRLHLAGKNVILFFGYIRKYKGLMNLIEAFPAVKKEIPNAHLLIVGEFYDNERSYRQAIDRLGIQDDVTVVQEYVPNEDVHKYFTAAQVVVLPYNEATQSGILSIAQSFAVPAIVTNVGGLAELVADGKTGLVVEPHKIDLLSQAIIKYFTEEKQQSFSDEIVRRRTSNSFTQITNVFDTILSDI